MVKVHVELVGCRAARRAAQRGDVTVIIDVLRASSSIVTALSSGAEGVIPTSTLKEARRLAGRYKNALLAGERRMRKPRDFHLGNSPIEFMEGVRGRLIVLTTTDGTRAIRAAADGSRAVLVGALLNASFVAQASYQLAMEMDADISLVVVGRMGGFALEDYLGAGLIAGRIPGDVEFADDQAFWAWRSVKALEGELESIIQRCPQPSGS